jgi:hypothetical protein
MRWMTAIAVLLALSGCAGLKTEVQGCFHYATPQEPASPYILLHRAPM